MRGNCKWEGIGGKGLTHWYYCQRCPVTYDDGRGCADCPYKEPGCKWFGIEEGRGPFCYNFDAVPQRYGVIYDIEECDTCTDYEPVSPDKEKVDEG